MSVQRYSSLNGMRIDQKGDYVEYLAYKHLAVTGRALVLDLMNNVRIGLLQDYARLNAFLLKTQEFARVGE